MTTAQSPKSGKILTRFLGGVAIVVILITAIGFAAININQGNKALEGKALQEVQEGPLVISTTVAGTIQARERMIIKSELEGSSTILFIVPEGEIVKKGDLLVELDATTLQDQLVDQHIDVQNAEASFISARENLAIVENQAQSDVEQAQLDYELAILDLEKYEEGDYPKSQKEAETNIILSEEEVNRSEDVYKWSQVLFEEKYLSQTELQSDSIAAKKAKLALDLANVDLDVLNSFQYKRQIAELNSNVNQTSMALERAKRKASANIIQASAEMQARQSALNQQISKLRKMEDQIAKAKIYAPMDGQVVYATSVRSDFRRNQEPLQEGQEVRERQELIHLPTTAAYMAEVKVHESSLERIHIGLPVRITVDALPGKAYIGRVAVIAPLPDAQSVFMNPDLKVYRTEIHIEGDGESLRTGMSCQSEIILNQFDNTLMVPVQAVVRLGGKPVVYVAEGNNLVPKGIELGPDNNRLAQVVSGLQKGDTVYLTPPLTSTQTSYRQGKNELLPEISSMLEEAKANRNQPAAMMAPPEGMGEGMGSQNFGVPDGEARPGRQGRQGNRPSMENMTPEQQQQAREERRRRMENMSPEERQQMQERFRNRAPSGDGEQSPRPPRGEQAPQE